MLYRFFLLLSLFLVGVINYTTTARQGVNFTSLTTKDGLTSNSVSTILKDKYGLMWFATEDGLNKFDGTNFTAYRHKPDDSTSLMANEILSLHEDEAGNLWIGTGGGSLSLYNRQKDAFSHFPAYGTATTLGNNVIRTICSDYRGTVWVGHYAGINLINSTSHSVSYFTPGSRSVFHSPTNCIFEDRQHNMWIGTNEGLFLWNGATCLLKQFVHTEGNPGSLSGNSIHTITEDRYGNMWVGTVNGLSMLQPGKSDFVNYYATQTPDSKLSNNTVNALAVDADNRLWIGTSNGLDILNIRTGEIEHLKSDLRNVQSLSYNGIQSIYIDKQGINWIGTYRGGVDKYDRNLNLFPLVQGNPLDEQGLHAKIVNAFTEDANRQIYVGTEDGGISLFNPQTGALRPVNLPAQQLASGSRFSVSCLHFTHNKQLLAGTYSQGLLVLDPATGNVQQLLETANGLTSNSIASILEDHLGNRWLGTNGKGIVVLNPANSVIGHLVPNSSNPSDINLPINGYIRDIAEDKNGLIWIASHGDGIAAYNPQTRQFKVYNTRNSNLPGDKAQTILADSRGLLWVGTLGGGVCLLDQKTGRFRIFSEKEGLPNSNIRKIVEDQSGLVWVSTNQGLSTINASTFKINNYNYGKGIQHNDYTHGAGLCAADGTLYFGGSEGFNYFNPENLKRNASIPKVLITDLKVSNQSVSPSADGPIQENISVAKAIHLDYKQNFSLSFVGLNYTAPEQNRYAYKLEGFDRDWNYVGGTTTASYTNLDPGEYTFKVMASNNDDVWNKEGASIKIYVHPPFWRTWFAYLFYVLAFVGVLLYIRRRGIKKLKQQFAAQQLKTQMEQERKEAETIHELDEQKIKFLTNLSHEFRTPISLIIGPAETLLAQAGNERQNGQLQLIKRNSRRLLNMVNQLLDFRKMEEHELRLQLSGGEFVSFVKDVTESFRDLSEKKKISFAFSSSFAQLHTRFDHDKVERILFNLLSNAFKFTLNGGSVSLLMEKEEGATEKDTNTVTLQVIDTGIGIPTEQQAKIFERFFQHTTAGSVLNQGTGIGLSITKEFVEMQGGTIEVNSEPEKGTTFTVKLPLQPLPAPATVTTPDEAIQEQKDVNAISEYDADEKIIVEVVPEQAASLTPTKKANGSAELSSILLVEDNEDFRFYLKDNLQQYYKVYEAANGKEGWQKALALHPQIIVSDVNMPYMDGVELCKKLKADKRTSHIPIILLTALTAEQDQLRGLETGANDYITKPFNFEVLNAKVKNLLMLNKTLKTTYSKQIKVLAPEVKVESQDEKLMERIMLYLEENLTNSQLSVEELSRQVGMSRSSLYSKLLELTGQTPVEFIRSVKLEKAAVLLQKSDMTIAQIAYSVGFATPNYFTKAFKTKYDMLPSEYSQKRKGENSDNER